MPFPSLLPASLRRDLAVADPRWRSKTVLHLLTVNFTLVAVILFSASIHLWDDNFFHASGPSRGDWTDGLPLAPLLTAFLFSSGSIINLFVRQKRCPPLLNIITHVSVIMVLLIAIVFAGVGALFPHWQPEVTRSSSGIVICNALNMFTRECEPTMYRIGEMQIGAIIFSILVWLNTSVLLLIAVQEWRDTKAAKKHQLRKLNIYSSDVEQGGRTGQRISVRQPVSRMSYLRPPSRVRLSRYGTGHNLSTDTTSTTVPFVLISDEPSYPPPIRYR